MPGKEVKNWKKYESLRDKGMSKEQAAKITNAQEADKKKPAKKGK